MRLRLAMAALLAAGCSAGGGPTKGFSFDLAADDGSTMTGDLGGADAVAGGDLTTAKCRNDDDCRNGGPQAAACCAGACVDTSRDSANCGGCAKACVGTTCCNSACRDFTSDAQNCGACGHACQL